MTSEAGLTIHAVECLKVQVRNRYNKKLQQVTQIWEQQKTRPMRLFFWLGNKYLTLQTQSAGMPAVAGLSDGVLVHQESDGFADVCIYSCQILQPKDVRR